MRIRLVLAAALVLAAPTAPWAATLETTRVLVSCSTPVFGRAAVDTRFAAEAMKALGT